MIKQEQYEFEEAVQLLYVLHVENNLGSKTFFIYIQ